MIATSSCQAVPALQAACFEDRPSSTSGHAVAEAVVPRASAVVRLERTFQLVASW